MVRRKRGGMSHISGLVARAYPRSEPPDVSAMRAFAWWCKAVPVRVLKNARPVRFSRGVLTVHTSTSAWANTLQLESERFLQAIAQHAPEATVKKISFRVGALPDMPLPPRKKPELPLPGPLLELPESVARELVRIANDELRNAVARAASTGLAEQPAGRATGKKAGG